MPKFFTEFDRAPQVGDTLVLTGANAAHIALSLRSKPGEQLTVGDGGAANCCCEITTITGDCVTLKVLAVEPVHSEPQVKISLFQALLKGDSFETVIQKSVELGVYEIYPVLCTRSISRPNPADSNKKVERWSRISEAAAKQCGRGIVPRIHPITAFAAAATLFCGFELPLFAYENSEKLLRTVLEGRTPPQKAAVFVGPEGGFAPAEADRILTGGGLEVSLGKRILRAETAPLALLAALAYAFGEF